MASQGRVVRQTDGFHGEQLQQRLLRLKVARNRHIQLQQTIHGDGNGDGNDDRNLCLCELHAMENTDRTYIEMTPSGTPRVFAIQARVVKYNGR